MPCCVQAREQRNRRGAPITFEGCALGQGVFIYSLLKIRPWKKEASSRRLLVTHFVAAALPKQNTRALELSSRASSDDVPRAPLAVFRRVRSCTAAAPLDPIEDAFGIPALMSALRYLLF